MTFSSHCEVQTQIPTLLILLNIALIGWKVVCENKNRGARNTRVRVYTRDIRLGDTLISCDYIGGLPVLSNCAQETDDLYVTNNRRFCCMVQFERIHKPFNSPSEDSPLKRMFQCISPTFLQLFFFFAFICLERRGVWGWWWGMGVVGR